MSESSGYGPGVPCWVDTWRADADGTLDFYARLFGWEAARGADYSMLRLRGLDVAGVGQRDGTPPAWTTYVQVADAAAAAEAVTAAGGTLAVEPFPSLDGGRIAIVADPAGATLGVWQLGEHGGAQVVNEPGAWAMSVLITPEPDAADAFYRGVFGWETEDFGGATMYRLPGYVGGKPEQPVPRDVVAVMVPGDTAQWRPDFWVGDVDAVSARADELGGRVVTPPEARGPGRTAVLADPAGAEFSISQVA